MQTVTATTPADDAALLAQIAALRHDLGQQRKQAENAWGAAVEGVVEKPVRPPVGSGKFTGQLQASSDTVIKGQP